jgi:hypothetical protein
MMLNVIQGYPEAPVDDALTLGGCDDIAIGDLPRQ